MSAEAFIANRYLQQSRQGGSAALLQWLGLLGVGLGVCSLIVVLSVMRGFEKDFERKILGFQAPLILSTDYEAWESVPNSKDLRAKFPAIEGIAPRIEGEIIIESSFGSSVGARIRGIDQEVSSVRGIAKLHLKPGSDARLGAQGDQLPGIVLGSELAASLQVHPDFNDEVTLIFPFGDVTPAGEMKPQVRRFLVVGIFDSGFYDYDSRFAMINDVMAMRLFREYGRYSLGIYLSDASLSPKIKQALQQDPANTSWNLSTWQERNQRLFQALLLERFGMFILLSMIVLISSFSIFALLALLVMEKIRDMAVLRTFGFMRRQVSRIFLWQAAKLGGRGALAGAVLGTLICGALYLFPYRLPPTYYIDYLPVHFDPLIILGALVLGPLMGLLAAIYPARRASLPLIASVLRYE